MTTAIDNDAPQSNARKTPWQPRNMPAADAAVKMWKNTKKAFEEHSLKESVYASAPDVFAANTSIIPQGPISCTHQVSDVKGNGVAHFYMDTELGVLVGVLEGIMDPRLLAYTKAVFERSFFPVLEECNFNAHQTFEKIIDDIQGEVSMKSEFNFAETVGVISYIKKDTGHIYTATLGKCESNVYRNNASIPLSCLRDWSSKSDAKRLGKKASEENKYCSPDGDETGFSRAIGLQAYRDPANNQGVTHKPKITVSKLKKGDVLVHTNHTLKENTTEKDIVDKITKADEGIAEALFDLATRGKDASNVVVSVIKVQG